MQSLYYRLKWQYLNHQHEAWAALLLGFVILLLWQYTKGRTHKAFAATIKHSTRKLNEHKTNYTHYLSLRGSLYIKPIVGFTPVAIEEQMESYQEYFKKPYTTLLKTSGIMRAIGYKYQLVTKLSPIQKTKPDDKKTKAAHASSHLLIGKTTDQKPVTIDTSVPIITLAAGSGSGKSKLLYTMIEQLNTMPIETVIIDLTQAFPRRIAGKARRITDLDKALEFMREVEEENDKRQALLEKHDIDNYKNLPPKHARKPIFIVFEEAYATFATEFLRDKKSERTQKLMQIADIINSLAIRSRKTGISQMFVTQSGNKSAHVINIGRAGTIIAGYLSESESNALLGDDSAHNMTLNGGIFLIKSPEFIEPQIFKSFKRQDKALELPLTLQNKTPEYKDNTDNKNVS